jgi:nucleoside-triphosphatase
LLITGLPRSGKTTLVRRLIERDILKNEAGGFFTEELRERGERVGFMINTIPEGKTALLARKNFPSSFRLGRYGINIKVLEELGCEAIVKALQKKKIVVVDEIGKMELFSDRFRVVLLEALNSPHKVLATIMQRPNPFADRIKTRTDVKLFSLDRQNFKNVYEKSKEWIKRP